ncbi:MAG: hypothetical protein ACLR23_08300 [Clostridia bacterium]
MNETEFKKTATATPSACGRLFDDFDENFLALCGLCVHIQLLKTNIGRLIRPIL